MKRVVISVCLTLLICGCSEIAKVQTENVEPEGIIEGIVMAADTNDRLSGAEVWLYLNGEKISTMTDGEGVFIIKNVPAGSTYTVYAKASEYTTAFADIILPDITSFPQGNARVEVNFFLYPLNGNLSFHVEYFPEGATQPFPATGAVIIIDLRSIGFDMVFSGETDANGDFTFTDLPADFDGLQLPVYVYYLFSDSSPPSVESLNVKVYSNATVSKTVSLFAPGYTPPPEVVSATLYGGTADNTGNVQPKSLLLKICYNMQMDTSIPPDFSNITSDVDVIDGQWESNERCYLFWLQVDPDTDGRGNYRIRNAESIEGVKQIEYVGTLD